MSSENKKLYITNEVTNMNSYRHPRTQNKNIDPVKQKFWELNIRKIMQLATSNLTQSKINLNDVLTYPRQVSKKNEVYENKAIEINDEAIEQMWKLISKIKNIYGDKYEMITFTSRIIDKYYSHDDIFFITMVIENSEILTTLTSSLNNEVILDELNNTQKNNLLYHIIFKGREFYTYLCTYPIICLYLINDNLYQNIYELLSKYL